MTRATHTMIEVVVVQYRLFHYRMRLFEMLRSRLRERGVELRLIVGQASPSEVARKDEGELDWSLKVRNRFWRIGGRDLLWQPLPRATRSTALRIVIQENRILSNYWLQLRRCFGGPQLAFWGHGRNYQSTSPSGLRERWKAWWLMHVDWWFGYTEDTRRYLESHGFDSTRITVLNNAIDGSSFARDLDALTPEQVAAARAELDITEQTQVAIYCGSIYPEKRIDMLLASADLLRQRLPDFHLLVVGDGPLGQSVRDAARTRPWLHALGIRTGAEKALAYRLASVMLNPGLVGLHVVDAFVARTPLVTQASALHSPEYVYLVDGTNGRVVHDDTVESYVQVVTEIFTQPGLLPSMQARCGQDAQTYTLDAMADNFAAGVVACLRRAGHVIR